MRKPITMVLSCKILMGPYQARFKYCLHKWICLTAHVKYLLQRLNQVSYGSRNVPIKCMRCSNVWVWIFASMNLVIYGG